DVRNKTNQLLQNVQDLKLSNEKLIQSEEIEREFVNTAAHELRTPTQAIMGYSELNDDLFEDIFKNDSVMNNPELKRSINQFYKHHETISRNALRLDTLINNLLDVARLESGSSSTNILVTLNKEKIDIVKEINDIINFQLQKKINDKNIKINFMNNSVGEHYWVYVDKSRLNQILNNLLDNAIKFSKNDSSIDILIKEEIVELDKINYEEDRKTKPLPKDTILKRREVYVAISDTGKGLSSNMLSKLFGKFVTDSDYGTGLGLFITKKLVEAHGGHIWAYNNKDGVGATFIFSLPMLDDNEDKNTSN
ncbi:MAG TPA: HAMP domain-containing sensor histidine kinase, partial [Candidatus Nitrosocosmicus sp.]|nr:HAMP domain-containing sensor histidine kinase [Candidatus Nitrosocosmicus sp.]